ncbi:hypothetical protein MTYP_01321 [Methylophilaceae bacterium]|nr:hypothetical protein MTYP_01321 [Methylophilaceae bacterium]
MPTKTVTAKEQMRAAQTFTFFSILAVLLLPALIPTLLWLGASIFVYAAAANHPNPKVCDYIKYSAYRFYGIVGALVVALNFSAQMAKAMGGWLYLAIAIWALCILIVVPFGVRDLIRAKNESWQDMEFEVDEN